MLPYKRGPGNLELHATRAWTRALQSFKKGQHLERELVAILMGTHHR